MKRRGVVMGALALATGCEGPPSPGATSEQASAIPRLDYPAPPPASYRISYLRGGNPRGRRIIFVHGTPGAADGWVDYLTDVPAGFEHIAVDRPGFGSSGPDGAVVSLAEHARALEPLLVNQGGGWPVLVGHSLGGPIVAWLAAAHPERVGALVILAGSLDPALEHIHWAQPLGLWPGIRSMLPRAMRNANLELMALKPQLEALQPMLGRIGCRVVIVHGAQDRLVPYANVPFMQAQMRRATISIDRIEGQNHFLPWNEQARVRRAIVVATGAGDRTC